MCTIYWLSKNFECDWYFNEVLQQRGIELPLEPQCDFNDDERYERGLAIQKELYGDEIKERYQYLPEEFREALPRF